MKAPITVLGIDPGLTRCGVGVVRGPVSRPVLVAADCVRTDVDLSLERRLAALRDALLALVRTHGPDVVAVERVLFSVNTRTAMATGQAAGVALLVAAESGLDVVSYSPNEVKETVTGDGGADKVAVARLVAAQLGLAEAPRPADVTDALAVALTHIARGRLDAAVRGTPAADELAMARRASARAARGGWEAVLADRARVAGADPRRAATTGGGL